LKMRVMLTLLIVAAVQSNQQAEYENEDKDLLPLHTQSLDTASLLSKFATEINEGTPLSSLMETSATKVKGRASSKYPRYHKVKRNGKMIDELVPEGVGDIHIGSQEALVGAKEILPQEGNIPVVAKTEADPAIKMDAQETSVEQPAPSSVETSEKDPSAYEFECRTQRTFQPTKFSAEELVALQADVCRDEPSSQWNARHDPAHSQARLSFAVDTANVAQNLYEASAGLAVRMYVLQPFDNCNRRTAACATVNALHKAHRALKKGVTFWDVKSKFDSLEGKAEFGAWDADNHQIKLHTASAEAGEISGIAKWLEDNTVSMQ